MSGHDIGTLYVLANRDNSLAKIGLTRNGKPDTRADDYAREHGIQWHVYWSAITRNVAEAEASAHRDLADFRFAMVPGAREIFHITPAKAQRVAARYVLAPKTEAQLAYEQAERERHQRAAAEAAAAQATAKMQHEAARKAQEKHAAQVEWELKAYRKDYRAALALGISFGAVGALIVGLLLRSATGDAHGAVVGSLIMWLIVALTFANLLAKHRQRRRIRETEKPAPIEAVATAANSNTLHRR